MRSLLTIAGLGGAAAGIAATAVGSTTQNFDLEQVGAGLTTLAAAPLILSGKPTESIARFLIPSLRQSSQSTSLTRALLASIPSGIDGLAAGSSAALGAGLLATAAN